MFENMKTLMDEGNYDELMHMAYDHDNFASSEQELKQVAEAYEFLIDKGYGIAANNLGSMYYCGRYFERNVLKAIQYYETACRMGEPLAWSNLGCCYYYELKDYRKAFEVFAEGAALFREPECLYMLGDMYKNGYHVEKSGVKSFELYKRALQAINPDDERENSLQGDILCRIGETLVSTGDGKELLEGLKALYRGMSYLYSRLHENSFVDADIRKYKAMIQETEAFMECECKS